MGTPGMVFIAIDGEVKIIRSRYDGHVHSFGLGLAQAIREMPLSELTKAVRAYQVIDESDLDKSPHRISMDKSLSAYESICGARLGPQMRLMCMGLSPSQPSFAIPYCGLGPVLTSGAGPDLSDLGYDYGYVLDMEAGLLSLIHKQHDDAEPLKASMLWSIDFKSIAAIESEQALAGAFEAISGIEHDYDKPNVAKIQRLVDKFIAKAAMLGPELSSSVGSGEVDHRKKIESLPSYDRASDAELEPGKNNSGVNFVFPAGPGPLIAHSVLAVAAQWDPAVESLLRSSWFGPGNNGEGNGQLLKVGCSSKAIDKRLNVVFESFKEALGAIGQSTAFFSNSNVLSPMVDGDKKVGGSVPSDSPEVASRFLSSEAVRRKLFEKGGAEAIARRWDHFDVSLALHMARKDWVPIARATLNRPDVSAPEAMNLLGFALSTGDAELLSAFDGTPAEMSILRAPKMLTSEVSGMASSGAMLLSGLSPKVALAFVDRFNASAFAALAVEASGADAVWLKSPASCIAARRVTLVDFLANPSSEPSRFMGF